MRLTFSCALFPAMLAFQLVTAIYDDQIGKLDWHKHLIGKNKLVLDDKLNDEILFSVTENNVLVALNATDSSIIWRHVPGQNEKILDLKQLDDKIFTVSGDTSQYYRMWNKDTGLLVWEHANNKPAGQVGGIYVDKDSSNLLATTGKSVFRFNSQNGDVVWSRELKKNGTDYGLIVAHSDSLFLLGNLVEEKKSVHVVQLKLSDGEILKGYKTASGQTLDSANFVLLHSRTLNPYIVWRDQDNIVWNCHKLGITKPPFVMFHAKLIQEELMPPAMLDSVIVPINVDGLEPMIGLIYNHQGSEKMVIASLFEKNLEPEFKKVADFSHSHPNYGRSTFFVSQNGIASSMVFRVSGNVKYQFFDLKNNGKVISSGLANIPDLNNRGKPQAIYSNSDSSRFFIQTNDGLLCGYSTSQELTGAEKSEAITPQWSRDESLASITDSVFVNYSPLQHSQSSNVIQRNSVNNWVARWIYRVYDHTTELYSFVATRIFRLTNPNSADSGLRSNDSSIFNTIIVFVTKYGRVAAYDSLKGNLLWGYQLKNEESSTASYAKRPWLRLQKVYNTKDDTSQLPSILVSGLDLSSTSVLTTINPLTGEIIPGLTKDFATRAHKIIETDLYDQNTNQKCYLLINNNKGNITAQIWPSSPALPENASKEFYFTLGTKSGSTKIAGYKATLKQSDSNDSGSETTQKPEASFRVSTSRIWDFDLGADNLKLLEVAALNSNLRVSSIGRILSSRKVLYKYLNPNTMLLLAGPQNSNYGMKVFLLDSVSGRILYSVEHPTAFVGHSSSRKPLAVMSENWAAYYFWNERDDKANPKSENDPISSIASAPQGYTIASLELFETDVPDMQSSKKEFSSYDIEKPFVVTQSYLLPSALSALGVTNTYNGITMQSLILALRNSPISLVPYSHVDPRRPTPRSKKELESNYLAPYEPVLNLAATDMISYSLSIKGVDTIKSTFTNLESTATVLVTGLDVFCTRVAPSGTFDELSASFSKWNLVITIVSLVTASIVVAPFAKRITLNNNWA